MIPAPIRQFLKFEHIGKTPSEILRSGTNVLIGVTDPIAKTLGRLQIKTVFDLSGSRIFRTAEQIAGALDNEGSILKIFGRVASEMVNDAYLGLPPRQLAAESIIALEGIGKKNFEAIREAIQLETVRDLSLWPPFLAAKAIFDHVFTIDTARGEDPEAPGELLPVARNYWAEKRYIQKVFIDEGASRGTGEALNQPIDIMRELARSYFSTPMLGALMTFEQTWTPHGLSLGSLNYSLALAPGESTRIALVDWQRQEAARLSESTEQQERLTNLLSQNSAISEIASGVTREIQEGNSDTTTDSSSSSGGSTDGWLETVLFGGGSSGGASTKAHTLSVSSSSGQRDVALETRQDIRRSTQQQAASVRSRRATAVKEVRQSETEEIRTRIITNYNHSHAMSVHYYEVLQIYRMSVRHARTERLIFVPLKPLDLSDKAVLRRFRHVLKSGARTPAELELIAHYTGEVKLTNLSPQSGAKNKCLYLNEDSVVEAIEMNGASLNRRWVVSELQLELQNGQILRLNDPTQVRASVFRFKPDGVVMLKEISRVGVTYQHLLEDEERMFAQTVFELQVGDKRETRRVSHHLATTRHGDENNPLQKWLAGVEQNFYTGEFINVLVEDEDYFSGLIWNSLNESQIARILARFTYQGRPLLGSVDFPPLGLYGNCLVFKYRHEDDADWRAWKKAHIGDLVEEEDFVSVPTDGVFAEAVLGRFNSSEKIDLTRFWNWQDSPIPFGAPEIAPVSAQSRMSEDTTQTAGLEQPLVNIVQPPSLPDPQGMNALNSALTAANVFRDMSGLAESIAANRTALQSTGDAAVGQAKIASDNFRSAVDAAAKVAQAVIGVPPVGAKGGKSSTQFGGEINLAREIENAAATGAKSVPGSGGWTGGASGAGGTSGSPGETSGGRSLAERLLRNAADPGGVVYDTVEFAAGQFQNAEDVPPDDSENREEQDITTANGKERRRYFFLQETGTKENGENAESLESGNNPTIKVISAEMNYRELEIDAVRIFIMTPRAVEIDDLNLPYDEMVEVVSYFNTLIPDPSLRIQQIFIGDSSLHGRDGAFRVLGGTPTICLPNIANLLTDVVDTVAHESAHGLLDALSYLSSGLSERPKMYGSSADSAETVLPSDQASIDIRCRCARFYDIYTVLNPPSDEDTAPEEKGLSDSDKAELDKVFIGGHPFQNFEEFFADMLSTYKRKKDALVDALESVLKKYDHLMEYKDALPALAEGYLSGWTPDIEQKAGLSATTKEMVSVICDNFDTSSLIEYQVEYNEEREPRVEHALWACIFPLSGDYGVFIDPPRASFARKPCDLNHWEVTSDNITESAEVIVWNEDRKQNLIVSVKDYYTKEGTLYVKFKDAVQVRDNVKTDVLKGSKLLLLEPLKSE